MGFENSVLLKVGLDSRGVQRDLGRLQSRVKEGASNIAKTTASIAIGGAAAFGFATQISNSIGELESLGYQLGMTGSSLDVLKSKVFQLNEGLALRSMGKTIELLKRTKEYSGATGKTLFDLAKATGMISKEYGNQEDIVKAQTSLMRTYGVSVKESADAVLYLKNQGGDLKNELFDTLLEYAPQFKDAGMSFNDGIKFMSSGLKNSWSVDKIADMAKEMNLRFQGLEKSAVTELKKLGAEHLVEQVKKGEKSSYDVFKELYQGKFSKDKNSQLKIGKALFGTQFEDVGKETVQSVFEGMQKEINFSGELDKLQNSLESRTSFKFDKGMSKVTNQWNDLLQQLAPILSQLLDRINSVLSGFTSFSKDFPNLTKGMIDFSMAATASLVAFGGIYKLFKGGRFLKSIAGSSGALKSVGTAAGLTSLSSTGASKKVKLDPLTLTPISSADKSKTGAIMKSAKSLGSSALRVAGWAGIAYVIYEALDYFDDKVAKSIGKEKEYNSFKKGLSGIFGVGVNSKVDKDKKGLSLQEYQKKHAVNGNDDIYGKFKTVESHHLSKIKSKKLSQEISKADLLKSSLEKNQREKKELELAIIKAFSSNGVQQDKSFALSKGDKNSEVKNYNQVYNIYSSTNSLEKDVINSYRNH